MPQIPQELSSFLEHFPGKQIFCVIKGRKSVLHFPGTIEQHYTQLKTLNEQGYEIYFTVNISSKDSRRNDDIVEARAVFIDVDKMSDSGPLSEHALAPSIIVESSPGKYHYYWLTSTDDLDTWRDVQKRLIKIYDSDTAIKDPARLLRLPTFKHRKGSTCHVVVDNGKFYEWPEILQYYVPLKEPAREQGEAPISTFDMVGSILKFVTGESIAPSMNSLIMSWSHRYSRENIRGLVDNLFLNVPEEVQNKHEERYEDAHSQIDKFINSARKKVGERVDVESYIWPEVTPLPKASDLYKPIPFPINNIPDSMLRAAKAIADFNMTNVNSVIPVLIEVVCMSVNRKVYIQCGSEALKMFCCMSIISVAKSGGFKSTVFKMATKGFIKGCNNLINEYNDRLPDIKRAIAKLKAEIDKKDKGSSRREKIIDYQSILDSVKETSELTKKFEELKNTRIPCQVLDDITQEAAIHQTFWNGGHAAFVADEGQGIAASMGDKYNKGKTSNDFIIRGMSNSSYTYNRKSIEEPISFTPVISALIFVQPDIYEAQILNNKAIFSSGLAARLITLHWGEPDYLTTGKTLENVDPNEKEMVEYYKICEKLTSYDVDIHKATKPIKTDEPYRQQLIMPLTQIGDIGNKFKPYYIKIFNNIWRKYASGRELDGKNEITNKCLTLSYIIMGTLFCYKNYSKLFTVGEHQIDESFMDGVSDITDYLIETKLQDDKIKKSSAIIKHANKLICTIQNSIPRFIDGLTPGVFKSQWNTNRLDSEESDAFDKAVVLLTKHNYLLETNGRIFINPKYFHD